MSYDGKPRKTYIGDGVYMAEGSYVGEVVLTTENGVSVTNEIVLEPPFLELMNAQQKRWIEDRK